VDVLVSDTSVVIDLERSQLIERVFRLPYRFVVPSALYEQEMQAYGGERLSALGLAVRSLSGVAAAGLGAGLRLIAAHPRCRLPREAIDERLIRYQAQ
jgi:hypothetical protein